jgi:hypothetical protein
VQLVDSIHAVIKYVLIVIVLCRKKFANAKIKLRVTLLSFIY